MKLTYFIGKSPNFGDELNPYIWDKVLPPDFLDEDDSEIFLGIGSIILDTLPKLPMKHVMGSGYGGYSNAPDLHDGTWNVCFVRGPRTAHILNLPKEKAMCDSAVLIRGLELPAPAAYNGAAFMPHFHSFDRGFWPEVCKAAGVKLIDPRDPVESILSEIRGAKVLVTEAMHGAIVADALRTPWVAASPIHIENRMKWLDWSESLDLHLRSHKLLPSSMMEAFIHLTGSTKNFGPRGYSFNKAKIFSPLNQILIHTAARRLQNLARQEPQLSTDAAISRATERASEAVNAFVQARTVKS